MAGVAGVSAIEVSTRASESYLKAALQGITQVLGDLVHSNAAHRSHSQSSDEGVGVLGILCKTELC